MNTILKDLLECSMEAAEHVIRTHKISKSSLSVVDSPIEYTGAGVIVGVTGSVYTRIFYQADTELFAKVAELMYGLVLEEAMLESFIGELGNMIAGNTLRFMSERGHVFDISPPTVMLGDVKVSGFDKALTVHLNLNGAGALKIAALVANEQLG